MARGAPRNNSRAVSGLFYSTMNPPEMYSPLWVRAVERKKENEADNAFMKKGERETNKGVFSC